MKKFLVFFSFILSLTTVSTAQSDQKNWVRVQAGVGFCGTGDRSGYVVNLSAGRYFLPRFKAGLGLAYAGFDNGVYEPEDGNKANALSIEANAYFNIVQTRFFKVELGAGPHVQFWAWQYQADQNTTIFISGPDISVLPNQKVKFDETQLGYNASLGLVVTPLQGFELGVWGIHQTGFKGNNISTVRAGIGFRF